MVDLNSATKTQLKAIPGIGEATASKILDFREENEVYVNKEEVLKAGVQQYFYDRVRNELTVCRPVEVEQKIRKPIGKKTVVPLKPGKEKTTVSIMLATLWQRPTGVPTTLTTISCCPQTPICNFSTGMTT